MSGLAGTERKRYRVWANQTGTYGDTATSVLEICLPGHPAGRCLAAVSAESQGGTEASVRAALSRNLERLVLQAPTSPRTRSPSSWAPSSGMPSCLHACVCMLLVLRDQPGSSAASQSARCFTSESLTRCVRCSVINPLLPPMSLVYFIVQLLINKCAAHCSGCSTSHMSRALRCVVLPCRYHLLYNTRPAYQSGGKVGTCVLSCVCPPLLSSLQVHLLGCMRSTPRGQPGPVCLAAVPDKGTCACRCGPRSRTRSSRASSSSS